MQYSSTAMVDEFYTVLYIFNSIETSLVFYQ